MTLLAISPAANANMSADGCVRLVGRAGLEVMTGGGLAAVQHAKVPAVPLQLKATRADVGVGQSNCIRFTTPSLTRCTTPSHLRPDRGLRRPEMWEWWMKEAGLPLPEPELRSQHEDAAVEGAGACR